MCSKLRWTPTRPTTPGGESRSTPTTALSKFARTKCPLIGPMTTIRVPASSSAMSTTWFAFWNVRGTTSVTSPTLTYTRIPTSCYRTVATSRSATANIGRTRCAPTYWRLVTQVLVSVSSRPTISTGRSGSSPVRREA